MSSRNDTRRGLVQSQTTDRHKALKGYGKNGLIYREAVPYDARLKRIVATEKAMQYQELIHQSLEETEDRLTSGISSQDLAVFFRVINQMIRNMS